MHALGRIASKLFIWLTAIAMPLQTGWAAGCGCVSARDLDATVSNASVPMGCCCCTQPRTRACCERKSTCCQMGKPKRSCCDRVGEAKRCGGCQCGPNCHCADRHDSSPQPLAPAPHNERDQSQVKLTLPHTVTTDVTSAENTSCLLQAASDRAISTPGTQVCVLLCRFTL